MVVRESLLSYDVVKVRAHQMHDQVDILKILKCHRGSEHIQKTYHLVCVEVHKITPRRRIYILGVNRGVCINWKAVCICSLIFYSHIMLSSTDQ